VGEQLSFLFFIFFLGPMAQVRKWEEEEEERDLINSSTPPSPMLPKNPGPPKTAKKNNLQEVAPGAHCHNPTPGGAPPAPGAPEVQTIRALPTGRTGWADRACGDKRCGLRANGPKRSWRSCGKKRHGSQCVLNTD
jgi:hypothetical protein